MFYNYTEAVSMDDGCLGFLKHVICFSEFPACEDTGNNKFVRNE